ncbi:uncharacterized protein [Rutidosis leptorrhynchoides]|uniref:uncharacterized protein n=1 Tax=Rutidosis leptorrhynchoides TaxID=125765 RepID=UPI003A99F2FF
MAGAVGAATITAATTTTSPFPPASQPTGKTRITSSSLPSSFPSRVRRTSHLRKKILKTLENKPYPDTTLYPQFPAEIQTISIDEASKQQQIAEVDQFSVSESTGFLDGIASTFSNQSFAKIGLYLVGAFVFQTICAVLIFGSNDLDDKDENLDSDSYEKTMVRANSESKSKSGLNSPMSGNGGGMVLIDESEMDNKIDEIREMAREARKQEKVDAKRKGLVEDGDEDEVDFDLIDKNLKEKEVDGRLMKLRKSLEGEYEKLPNKFPKKEGDVSNDGDIGVSAATDTFGSLMFNKRFKHKSPSIDSGDKPKGFSGATESNVANGTLINGVTFEDEKLQMNKRIDGETSSNDDNNGLDISVTKDDNKEQESRVTKTELIAGTSYEPKHEKQASKTMKSGKSNNMETRKPRGFGKESPSISTEQDDSNRNSNLKGKKVGNRKSTNKCSSLTEFWWTRLPYVLAVLMQRGGEREESEGLFTLRSTSQSKSGLSHTVAFEDRSDATNFCYLLESFFEDLGDFYTNIIPIPTNELEEAVKSQKMNVVVVKKGQLQLYVGQPLTDVESALRTLIEQSERL